MEEPSCADGEARPKLLLFWQCEARVSTRRNAPCSKQGSLPQLSVATRGQASLLLKITSTTTGVLTKSHLPFQTQNTTSIRAFHGQREACRNGTAEQARRCAISINAHCLRASKQQH